VTDFLNLTLADLTNTNVTRSYNVTKVSVSWTYGGLDRALMPTRGVSNQLGITAGVPIFKQSLSYYIATDTFLAYVPITHGFILNVLSTVGYGRGNGPNNLLPFIYNFYAGGLGTVPGFASNTLGPKYFPATTYGGSALGGNLLTTVGLHLIFPNFISDTLRTALTVDAGNVFQSPVYQRDTQAIFRYTNGLISPLVVQDNSFALRNFRASAGVLVTWFTPFFGPISVSLAYPLSKRFGDQLEPFQFAMGLSF
jgi:outer membrane protein insertion porin family